MQCDAQVHIGSKTKEPISRAVVVLFSFFCARVGGKYGSDFLARSCTAFDWLHTLANKRKADEEF